jgi:23S rRNA (pseudouridine1915-N3)-methyltransferase
MRIVIVAVGKLKRAGLRTELDDYLARIRRYAPCQEVELKDGTEREVVERFARAIPPRSLVVALEVEGQAHDSPGVARFIARCEQSAVAHLVFLIGGAYGLPSAVSRAADQQLSLSRLTLPHRLARLVLAEQVYRAFTILRNEPYSH